MPIQMYGHVTVLWTVRGGGWDGGTFDAKFLKYITDYWLLITDYWLLITNYWLLITDYWLLITDY